MIDDTTTAIAPSKIARADITAASLNRLTVPIAKERNQTVTIADMCTMLETALHDDAEGKQLLFDQAQTLNAIFHRLLEKGIGGKSLEGTPMPEYVTDGYILLALKAQRQCAMTIDALSKIKTREAFCESGTHIPPTPTPLENRETN
ncbi:MAG: hypothetical protein JKY11_05535 [Alphaproteobacteria bacterium]|nr:hypothetical protein [Alphaproteobacteria bacterium]